MSNRAAKFLAKTLILLVGCDRDAASEQQRNATEPTTQSQERSSTPLPNVSPRPRFERPPVSPAVAQWTGYVAVTRGVLGIPNA